MEVERMVLLSLSQPESAKMRGIECGCRREGEALGLEFFCAWLLMIWS